MENDEKLEKRKNIEIIILSIIIVCLLGILIYMIFIRKDNDNNINNDNTPENVEIKDDEVKKELIVYKSNNGDLCIHDFCSTNNNYQKAFTIKARNESARLIATENTNTFIIYDDDGIKIYNVNNKNVENTTLEGNYNEYEIYLNEDENKVIGIGYQKEDRKVGYYNVSLRKKLYDGKYKLDYLPMNLQAKDDYLSLRSNDTAYLLSSKEEKIILSDSSDDYVLYKVFGKKGSYIFMLGEETEDILLKKLYTNDKKLFYSDDEGEYRFNYYNGFIYVNNDNVIKKYNSNGELILESKKYNRLITITDNYAIYVNNDVLYLENIDNPSENKEITNVKNEYYIWSSYYSRKLLDIMDEKNKKEGLYIVVEYGEKGTNGYYGIEYCYTANKDIIEYPIKEEIGGRAKPVLYLYPINDMKINVSFEHPEYLTTTYPKYFNSWNVYAKNNGDLYDENGKYYYALYWDEKRYHEVNFSEGFYVDKENAINFLEEKLNIIGLNDKERNEFIMYWLPVLEKNERNLVYFELTEERENTNKLIISPKPDSLLRVSIHIKKVDKKVNIKEQNLKSFNRVGFTAVEWGGMEY